MTARAAVLACATLALVPAAAAQSAGVTWERLPLLDNGPSERTHNVVFSRNAETDSYDIIWIAQDGPFVRPVQNPGGTWTNLCIAGCGPKDGLVTPEGTLLITAPAGPTNIDRLPTGGPWQYEVNGSDGGLDLFQTSLPGLRGPDGHGAIYAGGYSAYRSLDDGRPGSWEQLGPTGGEVVSYGEVPPSGALPAGRLLAGVYNGVSVSDDGGTTWTAGAGAYGFARYIAHSFAFHPEAGHPYGGAVLAGIDDLEFRRDSTATVYRSDDGGSTWSRAHRFSPSALGLENANEVVLLAAPDGSVWAGVSLSPAGPTARPGAIVRSEDGGRTWAAVGAGWGGYRVSSLTLGPDGRVYAGTDRGIWRTAVPVYAVSNVSDTPLPADDIRLRVYPNPASDTATVDFALAAPAHATVQVYDAQGRGVATVHDGPTTGDQRLTVDTASLASGTYVVTVATPRGVTSARLTVAH